MFRTNGSVVMHFFGETNGRILSNPYEHEKVIVVVCVLTVVNSLPDEDSVWSTPGSHIGNGGVVIDCGSTRQTTSTLRSTCSARRSKSDTDI